eukprot:SAG31_NODE_21501_length_548_cov_0.683742_1_plen_121_part_01
MDPAPAVATAADKQLIKLVLWNIDGTLTSSRHVDGVAGGPLLEACSRCVGYVSKGDLSFAGKTDQIAIRELLEHNDIVASSDLVQQIMKQLSEVMEEGISSGNFKCVSTLTSTAAFSTQS